MKISLGIIKIQILHILKLQLELSNVKNNKKIQELYSVEDFDKI